MRAAKETATMATRRMVLASAVAASLAGASRLTVRAQGATPTAGATPAVGAAGGPGVAIARVRKLPTAALNDAIYPDVMTRFLPGTAAIPGFLGYLFAFHETDPTASLTATFLRDEVAADAADAFARAYVGSLDPRFVVETLAAARGPVRIWATTDAPGSALPPFLHGCVVTMRNRTNAPGADIDAVVAKASAGLVPLLRAMPGFVLYGWIQTEGGRTAIDVWQTDEQLRAGDAAVARWVAANTAATTAGPPVVNNGRIGYAVVPGVG
jgi:hypothetical protein